MSFARNMPEGLVEDAIRETEQEIFNDVMGIEAADDNNYDNELEQVEGWDGQALSDEEIAERNLYGDDDVYFDRPIEGRERDQLASENENLKAQLAERNAALDQLQNGPERQEQFRQQAREMLWQKYGVMPTDDRVDQLVNDIAQNEQITNHIRNQRFNESMASAHREHGPDFERAFQSFTSMDKNNPTARALAQDVFNAPNPGERMMALANGGLASFNSTRGLHPDLGLYGARTGAVRSSRGRNDNDIPRDEMDEAGFGNAAAEMDVFNSVWDR